MISSGSAADNDGTLQIGDKIWEVNGQSVRNCTPGAIVDLLKAASNPVEIVVKRAIVKWFDEVYYIHPSVIINSIGFTIPFITYCFRYSVKIQVLIAVYCLFIFFLLFHSFSFIYVRFAVIVYFFKKNNTCICWKIHSHLVNILFPSLKSLLWCIYAYQYIFYSFVRIFWTLSQQFTSVFLMISWGGENLFLTHFGFWKSCQCLEEFAESSCIMKCSCCCVISLTYQVIFNLWFFTSTYVPSITFKTVLVLLPQKFSSLHYVFSVSCTHYGTEACIHDVLYVNTF